MYKLYGIFTHARTHARTHTHTHTHTQSPGSPYLNKHLVDVGVGGQTQVSCGVDVGAERRVDERSLQVHHLTGPDVQHPRPVADHVAEVQEHPCGSVPGQHHQMRVAVDLQLVEGGGAVAAVQVLLVRVPLDDPRLEVIVGQVIKVAHFAHRAAPPEVVLDVDRFVDLPLVEKKDGSGASGFRRGLVDVGIATVGLEGPSVSLVAPELDSDSAPRTPSPRPPGELVAAVGCDVAEAFDVLYDEVNGAAGATAAEAAGGCSAVGANLSIQPHRSVHANVQQTSAAACSIQATACAADVVGFKEISVGNSCGVGSGTQSAAAPVAPT